MHARETSKPSLKYSNELLGLNLPRNSAQSSLLQVRHSLMHCGLRKNMITTHTHTHTISDNDKRNIKRKSRAPMHQADIITFTFKVTTQTLLHRLLRRRNRMLFPRPAVVAAQDGHLALLATQRCKVWYLQQDWPANRALVTSLHHNKCTHSTPALTIKHSAPCK